jgi:hypothetical protein
MPISMGDICEVISRRALSVVDHLAAE